MPPKKKSTDVQVARGRLKGALKDIVGESDESTDESDPSIPQRGRPPKRHKTDKTELQQQREVERQQQIAMQNTFIMKLFDRSVDLAKYSENTSLYPICRAWMLNQPRSTTITNFRLKRTPSPEKREPLDNMLDDLKSGQITIVNSMPAVNYADINVTRVPSQLSFHKELSKDNIDLDYNLDKPKISKGDIMIEMKKRWTSVRKNWHKKVKDYQEKKYGKSMRVIEEIGKNII